MKKRKKKKKRGTTGTTQRTASGAAVSYTHCDVRTKSPLATTTTTTTVTTVRAPGINTPSKRKRENTRSPWPGLLPAGLASRGWLVRTERPPFGGGGGRWKKKKNGRGRKRKDKRKKIKKKKKRKAETRRERHGQQRGEISIVYIVYVRSMLTWFLVNECTASSSTRSS